MRIVCFPSHFDGDGYYRVLLPAQELRRQGHAVEVVPHVTQRTGPQTTMHHFGIWKQVGDGKVQLVKSAYDWLAEKDFDVLWMQQRAEPEWGGFIRDLQGKGKRVVVDSDDAWLGLPAWNPGSAKPQAEVDAMLAQVAAADLLTVATPALAQMYAPYQENVRLIRNRLDWGMWADAQPRTWRKLRVGWMGQLRWRRGDVETLRGVIGPWLQDHPHVEFVAAGDPQVHDLLGVPEAQRVTTNTVAFGNLDLADITAVMDIGLVPLDLTSDARTLNECKSHLKGMEYNACGIPFVAAPSESYRWWTDEGVNGFLASNPRQWREALSLLTDDVLRATMGRAGRDKARQAALDMHGHEWEETLAGHGHHADAAVTLNAA